MFERQMETISMGNCPKLGTKSPEGILWLCPNSYWTWPSRNDLSFPLIAWWCSIAFAHVYMRGIAFDQGKDPWKWWLAWSQISWERMAMRDLTQVLEQWLCDSVEREHLHQFIWLVVDLPVWKIWVGQLGWWFPIDGKIKFMFQSPPTSL